MYINLTIACACVFIRPRRQQHSRNLITSIFGLLVFAGLFDCVVDEPHQELLNRVLFDVGSMHSCIGFIPEISPANLFD